MRIALITLIALGMNAEAQVIPFALWKKPAGAKAAPVFKQGPVEGTDGVTSVSTANFASSVTAGNTIICALNMSATRTATFSDSKANTYSIAVAGIVGTCNPDAKYYIAYAKVVTGGTSFKVTATFSGSMTNNELACIEVSGVADSPVDDSGVATGSGTTYSTPVAVNSPQEFLFAYVAMFGVATANGGWTGASLAQGDTLQYRTAAATGTTNITGSLSSNLCYDIPYVGFKP